MNLPTEVQYLPLYHFQLSRPEKVRWFINADQPDALTLIKSSSLRKFLNKADAVLATQQITWELHPLTEQEYLNWLPYYRQKMSELKFEPLARESWYAEKISQGKIVEGIFFHQLINGVKSMIGSGVFVIEPQKRASFAYKASEHLNLSNEAFSSLGVIIDYIFLKEMLGRRLPQISAGKSGNAFGVFETYGYPVYKLRLGYEPQVAEDSPLVPWAPVNEGGAAMFYALNQNQQLGLYFFHPAGLKLELEHKHYASVNHPFYECEYDLSLLKRSSQECV